MTEYEFPVRYGLRPVALVRQCHIGLHGEPLTEERKKRNRENERNAQLQDGYNKLQRKLVNILDDKIFLAESLRFMASQISGGVFHIPRRSVEYEGMNEGLPLLERTSSIESRLNDAVLTLSTSYSARSRSNLSSKAEQG